MKINLKSVIAAVALTAGISTVSAQGYYDDDIYYNPDKVKKEKALKQQQQASRQARTYTAPLPGSDAYTVYTDNQRDVDEYNRRGVKAVPADSAARVAARDFAYTNRIERFYNPEVISGSNDAELQDYYYGSQTDGGSTTVNLYLSPSYAWGNPWFYDPWMWNYAPAWSWSYWDPFYSPWYGPSWSWSWGWGPSWSFGWGHHWGCGPSWAWGPGWGWGPGHIHGVAPGRPYRPAVGGMMTHRGGNSNPQYTPTYGGRRSSAVNSRDRYNNSNSQVSRPSNNNWNNQNNGLSGQRRGGNVRQDNVINHNTNSNSSWGRSSGSSNRSQSWGGGSTSGGQRGGGGMTGGGRRR